ncbi:hypothetical protein BKA62DRAFT_69444 [Auriculariales sp. MPI-PUGE-AT-0066]|nr:hypothetical protein BKA62DRAFT_69444 [Auriculariales sp. MPI-PUGE-AT-0066]
MPLVGTPSLPSPMSRMAKLQSYLPTGTWISYTALQTWALSISPNIPPPTSSNPDHQSTCNSDQRIALCIAIALGLLSAFGTPFIKTFVLDVDNKRILFPPPTAVKVDHEITDHVTKATFPYQLKSGRWLWPIADASDGGFVRENGMIKVMEFKLGCEVDVRLSLTRMANSSLAVVKELLPVSSNESHTVDLVTKEALNSGREPEDMGVEVPVPSPWWKYTLRGGPGNQYIDLGLQVWLHAFISMGAFASLALFSTQVSSCIYPDIPDYLPGIAQTAMLAALGFIAAYLVNDESVSFGQATYSPHIHNIPSEDLKDVPPDLQSIVERVFFVKSRPGGVSEVHNEK